MAVTFRPLRLTLLQLLALLALLWSGPAYASTPVRAAAANPPDNSGVTLLYVDDRGSLVRYDPQADRRDALTQGVVVKDFVLSPADAAVAVEEMNSQWYLVRLSSSSVAPHPSVIGKAIADPIWSPDGSLLYLQLATGGASVVDLTGQERRLAFDAGPTPWWSRDGSYLAWLDTGTLWVARLDAAPQKVADGIGNIRWAPSGLRLAYETVSTVADPLSASQPEGRSTWVYDVAVDSRTRVAEVGGLAGWTADGQGIEIIRLTGVGASAQFWTMLVASPDGSRLVEVGPGSTEPTLGPSPVNIAWTPDGQQALILEGGWLDDARKLYYMNSQTHQQRLLFTQTGGLPHANNPGVWAALSPNGTWALVETVDRDNKYAVTLFRTDGSEQRPLGGAVTRPQDPRDFRLTQVGPHPFSSDERWLLDKDQQGWLLYDIRTNQSRRLASADSPRPLWLSIPAPVSITTPAVEIRQPRCSVEVAGVANAPGQVVVRFRNRPFGALYGYGPNWQLAQLTPAADGAWNAGTVELAEGDNLLEAVLMNGAELGSSTPQRRVTCGGPVPIYTGPQVPFSADTSKGSPITFRFDLPVDVSTVTTETVHLYGDGLAPVVGQILTATNTSATDAAFVFQPDAPLTQASYYVLWFDEGIRGQAPDDDLVSPVTLFTLHTAGVERERLIEAIQALAEAAADKIDSDVSTTAMTFSDIHSIEANLEAADFAQSVLSLIGAVAKAPRSIQELLTRTRQEPPLGKNLVIPYLSILETMRQTEDDLELPTRNENGRRWREAGLTEADLKLYEEAIHKGTNPNLTRSELEFVLFGTARQSPLRIPVDVFAANGLYNGGFTYGAGKVQAGIRAQAKNLIAKLPPTLPPDFPSERIYADLVSAREAISRSRLEDVGVSYSQPVFLPSERKWTLRQTSVRLGAIASDRRLGAEWLKAMEARNRVRCVITLYDAASTGISLMAQTVGSSGWQYLDWKLAPLDSAALGLGLLSDLVVDPRDLVPQVPVIMLNDLPMEIYKTRRIVDDVLTAFSKASHNELAVSGRNPSTTWWSYLVPTAYAAEPSIETDVRVTQCSFDDALIPDAQVVGSGRGRCTVTNSGANAQRVRARLAFAPISAGLGGGLLPGGGSSRDWVAIEPSGYAELDLAYYVVRPPIGTGSFVQALVTLDTVPVSPGGWGQSIGPFTQPLRVGTKTELTAMPTPQTQRVLDGELAAGEVQTTTVMLSADSPTLLLASYEPRLQLRLTLKDAQGHDLTPVDSWRLAGSGSQQIALPPTISGKVTLAVQGLVSARGRGLRYEISLLPASMEHAAAATRPASAPPTKTPVSEAITGPRTPSAMAPTVRMGWLLGLGGMALAIVIVALVLLLRRRVADAAETAWLMLETQRITVAPGGLRIGRGVSNGLVLPGALVSRAHANIWRRRDVWYIEDLRSTTGTFVKHQRVTRAVLHDGDEIGIGETLLVFHCTSTRH